MKRFKQHWSARPLSWLLSVALIWPAMFSLLAGGSRARAQTLAVSAQPLWAVLDFENHSGYGGPEVGREASDAFVVELGKSNKYEVLSRQDTQAGLANSGLTVPLDTIGLQKLGRAVSSNAVATGEVAAVSFSKSPRQATVSVIIRVVDSNTGELVNGALAQGTSNPRALSTSDDDALVNEAINNAGFAAVRQIIQFNLPKATVLNNEDQDRVLLNKGTRDGLYDGLDMVVTRNNNEVGRIRVSGASADQSDAVVTRRGLGIQPQDHAVAVYQLPSYQIRGTQVVANANDVAKDGSSSGHSRSKFSGITGLLIAILAGALLLSLIRRGGSSGSVAGAEVGKPAALEGRTDTIGGTGTIPASAIVTGTTGASTPFVPIAIRITATTGNITAVDFSEYHVYRSDFPPNLDNANAASIAAGQGTNTGLNAFGRVPLFSQTGQGGLQVYDDGGNKVGVSASKPDATRAGLIALNIGGVIPGTGIQNVGDRFQYFIEGLYIQPLNNSTATGNPTSPGNATPLATQLNQLTGLTGTNFVTYIEPVLLSADAAQTFYSFTASTSPDNVVVNVASTRSADDYILEIATDPGFGQRVRLSPDTSGPYVAAPATPRSGNPVIWYLQTGTRNQSLRQRFPNATQLFARVGARDSRNGPSESTNPYILSDPVQIPPAFVPAGSGVGGPPAAPAVRRG